MKALYKIVQEYREALVDHNETYVEAKDVLAAISTWKTFRAPCNKLETITQIEKVSDRVVYETDIATAARTVLCDVCPIRGYDEDGVMVCNLGYRVSIAPFNVHEEKPSNISTNCKLIEVIFGAGSVFTPEEYKPK